MSGSKENDNARGTLALSCYRDNLNYGNESNIAKITDPASPVISNIIKIVLAFCALIILSELATVIFLAVRLDDNKDAVVKVEWLATDTTAEAPPTIVINGVDRVVNQYVIPTSKPPLGDNICSGKNPDLPNVAFIVDSIVNVGPQAGADVTEGYQGQMVVDHEPILTPYFENSMCPVNVHWHLGTEHYSQGQYDDEGTGPAAEDTGDHRRELAGDVRPGFRCHLYDEHEPKFNTPYNWQHYHNMVVGETYEVHWPHSAAVACGTPNQYQTPFADGVFCRDGVLTNTASQIGVPVQVFVVVNDESYYYPDLFRGMIVDGVYGSNVAKYTGSTTGTTRDNEVCSQYSPITWQVDRVCQLISASSFDKMCADMAAQRDDMSDDMHPHGSRELVADELAANNHHRGRHLRAHYK
eukprot:scaffold3051_cov175-Amphora_coffeaeformis.AAC.4